MAVLRLCMASNSRADLKSSGFGGNDDEDDEEEMLRYVVCVTNKDDLKKVEEDEDCFIVGFDPTEITNLKNLSLGENSNGVDEDVSILAQKGKVACRDYPHSRHLCGNKPFQNTPHESHCKMCYCYICEIPAPCKKWTNVSKDRSLNHCDASEDSEFWRTHKNQAKNSK